jgi:membrane protein DedA with SNARE-associated domain
MDRSKDQAVVSGLLWGLAEATFFFIVPDVLLCYWALRSARSAFSATLSVVLGAMLGASLLYLFPQLSEVLQRIWVDLPGFGPKMITVAKEHLQQEGARGLLLGPTSGIPYRIYVVQAIQQEISWSELMLWTPLARLERIVIAPIVVLGLRSGLDFVSKQLSPKLQINIRMRKAILGSLVALYWIGLYWWYWGRLVPGLYRS